MKIQFNWKKVLPHVVAVLAFIALAVAYCAPMLEGKVLYAGDTNNWKGMAQEVLQYKDNTGEISYWTNSMFGGMPTYQIAASTQSGRSAAWWKIALTDLLGEPRAILLLYGIGFYLMLLCFGINPWLSLVGALAISLSSYFLLIIPAGHISKAFAIGGLAPIIGGFYAIFRRKYWLGAPLVFLFGTYAIVLHPQMTYYIFMLIGVMAIAELYIHIREKRWKDLGISIGVVALTLLLVFATKITWWGMNEEYLAETMRGGHSELVNADENANVNKNKKKAGLDIDYVTAWSYGIDETMTFLIPNFEGGASGYNVGEESGLCKDLVKAGVPKASAKNFCQSAPTYRGEKAFTSGPVYMGAIICMLFILGLILVPGAYKWALLAATLFSILLAWGRNLMPLTQFFYDYFPMYNKFRAVESILVVAEITIPLLGMLGVQQLVASKDATKKTGLQSTTALLIAGGITAGLCLVFGLFGSSIVDFESSYDANWKGQVGDRIYQMILDERAAMLRADAWRSLTFIVLGTAAIFAYVKGWLKKEIYLYGILAVLVLADMVPVNRRFFNDSNFVTEKNSKAYFAEQPWETEILNDKALDFRVFNLTSNTFNDSRTSYRLKSIGGYHAAKLRRYQDLIDAHITKNNFEVLNMLNTRYFITRNGVQRNTQAYGNAWFVDEVQYVNTPDEESQALWNTNLRSTAVADKKFENILDVTIPATNTLACYDEEYIRLTEYKPNQLTYTSQAERNKIAVFSEIYYPHGWHLYIDDVEQHIGRVDYVLRAAVIPAGIHTIRMEFVPDALRWDKTCTALIIILTLLSMILLCYPIYKRAKCRVISKN